MRRFVEALVSVMPRRSWSRFADLEFPDDPIEEVVGAWSRWQAVVMDARFCEAMERALAAERGPLLAWRLGPPLVAKRPRLGARVS